MSSDFYYRNDVLINPSNVSLMLNISQPWHPTNNKNEFVVKFWRYCDPNSGDDHQLPKNNNLPFYNAENILQPNDGLLWILHSPTNFPSATDQRSYLQFLSYNDVLMSLEIFSIDKELKLWPPEKRNCFLPGEKNLTFFKIYTKINCEQECLSIITREKCGCVPFYRISRLNF